MAIISQHQTQQICLIHPTQEQDSIHTVTLACSSYRPLSIHINTHFTQEQYHNGPSYGPTCTYSKVHYTTIVLTMSTGPPSQDQ